MSDSTPPPPITGNGKYIAVILLLVVGLGGILFVYKRSQDVGPTPVPSVTASIASSAPTNARLDDVPPPPDVPDADTSTPDASASNHTFVPYGPCEVKSCSGDMTPELNSSLSFRGQQARKCYQSALNANESLQGKVAISVRIATTGAVCSSSVASAEPGLEGVARCVADNFRATHFPSPHNGCIDTKVPLSFVPGAH